MPHSASTLPLSLAVSIMGTCSRELPSSLARFLVSTQNDYTRAHTWRPNLRSFSFLALCLSLFPSLRLSASLTRKFTMTSSLLRCSHAARNNKESLGRRSLPLSRRLGCGACSNDVCIGGGMSPLKVELKSKIS